MTPDQAISAVQQLSERLDGEPITFFPAFKESLDEVLKLACKGAGVEHPQTGYRGGIIVAGAGDIHLYSTAPIGRGDDAPKGDA